MNDHFRKAQDVFIEHAAQISSLFGFSDGTARMVALIYMSPEPVSIPTICEKLSLTKGTVSLYLRLLEERKIVTRTWSKRQGKQKFYEINPRLWTDFLDDLRSRTQKRLDIANDAVERSLQAINDGEYDGEDRIACRLLVERVERIREVNELSRTLLNRALFNKAAQGNGVSPLQKIELSET
jgi:DNA-binding transcriptional regulator GbsR (MarR family)